MSETCEFDPPEARAARDAEDERMARFATDGWVAGVASVPLPEMATMVAEDPSVVTALCGALRYARKRHQVALELAARISQEAPLPHEAEGWIDQRAKMIAAIGSLSAEIDEMRRAKSDPAGLDVVDTRAGMASFDRATKAWLWHKLDVALVELADWRDGRRAVGGVSASERALVYAQARAAFYKSCALSGEMPTPEGEKATDEIAEAGIGALAIHRGRLASTEVASRDELARLGGAQPPRPPGEHHGLFIARRHFEDEWSIGETYTTRQEAINGYAEEYGEPDGEHFRTARLHYKREIPPFPYDADRIVEQVGERMYGEWWDDAIESFVDKATGPHQKELDEMLQAAWTRWCERYDLDLHGYMPEEEEDHIVGEDEDDETIERRKREQAEEDAAAAKARGPG